MALHNAQELDNDLRGRADEDLTLAPALGIDNVVLVELRTFKSFVSLADHNRFLLTRQSFYGLMNETA